MARNIYWELFYHFNWHTKNSEPMLTPRVEPLVHRFLIHRALQTPDTVVHAVGGIEDHVHLVVSLPPTVMLSAWVGELKGACSHEINHGVGKGSLEWQVGYGVVSFGAKDLEWVVEYVKRQREHHAAGRVFDRLERITRLEEEQPRPQGQKHGEAR